MPAGRGDGAGVTAEGDMSHAKTEPQVMLIDILGHFPATLVGTKAVKEKHDVFLTPVAKPHWTLKLRQVTEKNSLLQAFIHRITVAKTALAMWLVLAK